MGTYLASITVSSLGIDEQFWWRYNTKIILYKNIYTHEYLRVYLLHFVQ